MKIVIHLLFILERLGIIICKHTKFITEIAVQINSSIRSVYENFSSIIIFTNEIQFNNAINNDIIISFTINLESFENRFVMSAEFFEFVMIMLQSKILEISFFQNKNVSKFLNRYEDIVKKSGRGQGQRQGGLMVKLID